MHIVYLLARTYPYWALGILAVLFQLTIFLHRRRNPKRFTIMGIGAVLVLGIFAWFFFRGDLHSDEWIRAMVER